MSSKTTLNDPQATKVISKHKQQYNSVQVTNNQKLILKTVHIHVSDYV